MTGTSFAVEPSRTTAFKISEKAKKNEIPIFFSDINHGDYFKWMKYIDELPNITVSKFDFTLDAVTIGDKSDCSIEERAILKNNLINQCSEQEKKEVFNFAFGEKFMKSKDKGSRKIYKEKR